MMQKENTDAIGYEKVNEERKHFFKKISELFSRIFSKFQNL
jgi:hypothetical protein